MGSEAGDGDWQVFRPWYNKRIMETNISAPIVDKQGDLIPTKTLTDSMDYYMKFGIYSYKHEEMPIGLPLAYRVKDGRIQLRVGIHDKLDMHNRVWDEIKSYGPRGASSIRGEALDQKQICTTPDNCFNQIDKLGLWSVSWVGDNPANPEATVQSVSMSKGCECEACGDEKSLRNDHENDYDDFEHIKEGDCPDCGLEMEEVAKVYDCPDCGLEKRSWREGQSVVQAIRGSIDSLVQLERAAEQAEQRVMAAAIALQNKQSERPATAGNKLMWEQKQIIQALETFNVAFAQRSASGWRGKLGKMLQLQRKVNVRAGQLWGGR